MGALKTKVPSNAILDAYVVSRVMEGKILKGFCIVLPDIADAKCVPLAGVKDLVLAGHIDILNADYSFEYNTLVGTQGSLTSYPSINSHYVLTSKQGIVVTHIILGEDDKMPLGVVCFNATGTRSNLLFKSLDSLMRMGQIACNFDMQFVEEYNMTIPVPKSGGRFKTVEMAKPKKLLGMYATDEEKAEYEKNKSIEITKSDSNAIPCIKVVNINAINSSMYAKSGQEKLLQAQIALKAISPYYFTVFSALKQVYVDAGLTMGVTETTIYIDFGFVSQKSVSELVFLLIHEVMHICMMCGLRRGKRDHDLWNIANDLYVNEIICRDFGLVDLGNDKEFQIGDRKYTMCAEPHGYYLSKIDETIDLRVDSPETIYARLEKENPPKGKQKKNKSTNGGSNSDSGLSEEQKKWKKEVKDTVEDIRKDIYQGRKAVQHKNEEKMKESKDSLEKNLDKLKDLLNGLLEQEKKDLEDSQQPQSQDNQQGQSSQGQSSQQQDSQDNQQGQSSQQQDSQDNQQGQSSQGDSSQQSEVNNSQSEQVQDGQQAQGQSEQGQTSQQSSDNSQSEHGNNEQQGQQEQGQGGSNQSEQQGQQGASQSSQQGQSSSSQGQTGSQSGSSVGGTQSNSSDAQTMSGQGSSLNDAMNQMDNGFSNVDGGIDKSKPKQVNKGLSQISEGLDNLIDAMNTDPMDMPESDGGSNDFDGADADGTDAKEGDAKGQGSGNGDGSGDDFSSETRTVTYNGKKLTGTFNKDIFSETEGVSEEARQKRIEDMRRTLQSVNTKLKMEKEDGKDLSKNAGASNGLMQRYIDFGISVGVDWKVILRKLCKTGHKKTFNLAAPDPAYMSSGMTIASRQSIGKPTKIRGIKFAIDVSGSVSEKELRLYLSEINNIFSQFEIDGELIYWSTEIGDAGLFSCLKDMLRVKPKSTGGTDVRCVFEYLNGEIAVDGVKEKDKIREMEAIFILTDGYFSSNYDDYTSKFGKKVIWLITGSALHFNPPFGRVIQISD